MIPPTGKRESGQVDVVAQGDCGDKPVGNMLKPRADHRRMVKRTSLIRISGVEVTSPHITRQRRGKIIRGT